MDRGAWQAPRGWKELDMTEHTCMYTCTWTQRCFLVYSDANHLCVHYRIHLGVLNCRDYVLIENKTGCAFLWCHEYISTLFWNIFQPINNYYKSEIKMRTLYVVETETIFISWSVMVSFACLITLPKKRSNLKSRDPWLLFLMFPWQQLSQRKERN